MLKMTDFFGPLVVAEPEAGFGLGIDPGFRSSRSATVELVGGGSGDGALLVRQLLKKVAPSKMIVSPTAAKPNRDRKKSPKEFIIH